MPQGGRVERLLVDEGDHVEQGQALLELWNRDIKARMDEVAATLKAREIHASALCDTAALAQREARRTESLARERLASDELLDQRQTESRRAALACEEAQALTEQAEATLRLHQVLLDETLLKAPFAGVVAEINGEVGEYVTPSPPGVPTPPAVDLIDDSCLYVRAPIDEVEAARLAVGQPVRITLDAFRGQSFAGEVSRIAPFVSELEKQARTVDVDVRFTPPPTDAHLLVGYSADIEVIIQQHADVLRVPTETLLQNNRVLRYDDDSGTCRPCNSRQGWATGPGPRWSRDLRQATAFCAHWTAGRAMAPGWYRRHDPVAATVQALPAGGRTGTGTGPCGS